LAADAAAASDRLIRGIGSQQVAAMLSESPLPEAEHSPSGSQAALVETNRIKL